MTINSLKKSTLATLATAICVISSPSTLAAEDTCCGCFDFLKGGRKVEKNERLLPQADIEQGNYKPVQHEAPTLPVKKERSDKLERLIMGDTPAARAIRTAIDAVAEDASFDITFINANICKLKVTTKTSSSIVVVPLKAESLL